MHTLKRWHKLLGQRLQQKLMAPPRIGRRRPKPNRDLFLTRFIMKILAQE